MQRTPEGWMSRSGFTELVVKDTWESRRRRSEVDSKRGGGEVGQMPCLRERGRCRSDGGEVD